MRTKVIFDVKTRQTRTVPFTAAEEAQFSAMTPPTVTENPMVTAIRRLASAAGVNISDLNL